MASKKKKRYPPSRYWMLCFDVRTSASRPASSIRASSLPASKGKLRPPACSVLPPACSMTSSHLLPGFDRFGCYSPHAANEGTQHPLQPVEPHGVAAQQCI